MVIVAGKSTTGFTCRWETDSAGVNLQASVDYRASWMARGTLS